MSEDINDIIREQAAAIYKSKEELIKTVLRKVLNREPVDEDAKRCMLASLPRQLDYEAQDFYFDKVLLGRIVNTHIIEGFSDGSVRLQGKVEFIPHKGEPITLSPYPPLNLTPKTYKMQPLINPNGITIKQLKELVKDLPEVDANGNDYEVWVMNTDGSHLSNQAKAIYQLNQGDVVITINP